MILITNNNDKILCYKTNKPKFNKRQYDFIKREINTFNIDFFFGVFNNTSNFYFNYNDNWYKTNIIQKNGFDLYNYLVDKGEKLYDKN